MDEEEETREEGKAAADVHPITQVLVIYKAAPPQGGGEVDAGA